MIVVNIFGPPCAGKSTLAAGLFALLKTAGIKAELVTEFAKDLVWNGVPEGKFYQPFVTATQAFRIERLRDTGIEVVVTDSPILLGAVYADPQRFPPALEEYIAWEHGRDPSVNIRVTPAKAHSEIGRFQNAEQSREIGTRIDCILADHGVSLDGTLPGDGSAPAKAFALVVAAMTRIDAEVARNELQDQMAAHAAEVRRRDKEAEEGSLRAAAEALLPSIRTELQARDAAILDKWMAPEDRAEAWQEADRLPVATSVCRPGDGAGDFVPFPGTAEGLYRGLRNPQP